MSSHEEEEVVSNLNAPLMGPTDYERLELPPTYEESRIILPLQHGSVRLLDRDAPFGQSRGHWGVRRLAEGMRLRRRSQVSRLRTGRNSDDHPIGRGGMLSSFWTDWFHSLAYRPTLQLVAIIFTLYTFLVFLFAYIYLGVSIMGSKITVAPDGSTKDDSFCGMDITNHMEALYFSLSTMTTIGYGVSDYYFGDCWTPLLLVLIQSCCAFTFQSVAIGLIFQRISRGQKRSRTIVFSDKAVVRRVKGESYLMFRIGELRRQQIINVSVRCYCVKHERYLRSPSEVETIPFITRQVRLLYPDQSLGSNVLLSIPQVVVHHIDSKSPLAPKATWHDIHGCPCDKNDLEAYHKDREMEIIVQIEGTDEFTGHSLQARHSYKWDEIAWNFTFVPCVQPWSDETHTGEAHSWFRQRRCEVRELEPICAIDFARFHDVIPAQDTEECPYVSI